jgi:hypothetical protein
MLAMCFSAAEAVPGQMVVVLVARLKTAENSLPSL